MKEFQVTISETLEKMVTIKAENKEEAKRLVQEQWEDEKYILGADDFTGAKFDVEDERLEENQLQVLLVEPGKEPKKITIGGDLEDLQEVIGGHIELAYYYNDPVVILCDEEGKLKGLPLNRAIRGVDGGIKDIMAGNFLICGDGEEDIESLSDDLMEKYKAIFEKPEEFFELGGNIIVCPMEVGEGKIVGTKIVKNER